MSRTARSSGVLDEATFTVPGGPGAIRACAAGYTRTAATVAQLRAGLNGASAPSWVGPEGEAYRARLAEFPPVLDAAQEAMSTVAQALLRFAAEVEDGQRSMAALGAQARELSVPTAIAATAPAPMASAALVTQLLAVQARAVHVRAQVDAAARSCGATIQGVATCPRIPPPVAGPAGLTPRSALVPTSLPPGLADGSDPAAVRRAWAALSPEQRQALIEKDPARWGNRAGVPVADRDAANRLTVAREIAEGKRRFAEAGLPVPRTVADLDTLTETQLTQLGLHRWGDHGGLVTDPATDAFLRRLRNGLATQGILTQRVSNSAPPLLHTFEPGAFGGDGRAAIAYGDPDHAANVAVYVPGATSKVSDMGGITNDARALRDAAQMADPRRNTSAIAWLGYDAPEIPQVASQGRAERGAQSLATEVAALRVTNAGQPRVTVVGHSYGSTTTGIALQRFGLADHVDQVVLIGSPGVGSTARSVKDLHLRRDQLYVGSAAEDVVTTTWAGLGANPASDDFGGTRFKAENIHRNPHPGPFTFDDHSRYFDSSTNCESLYSMSRIVTGRGGELAGEGMVAPGRAVDLDSPEHHSRPRIVDPEADRQPTSGHMP